LWSVFLCGLKPRACRQTVRDDNSVLVLVLPYMTAEYSILKRMKEKLQTDIIAQTRNMCEADERIRCYLQEDI